MMPITVHLAVSTMQTLLCGEAQVTNSRVSSAERARPSGDPGTRIESRTLRLAVSKRKMRLAVAQAMYMVFPSFAAMRAIGERYRVCAGTAGRAAHC